MDDGGYNGGSNNIPEPMMIPILGPAGTNPMSVVASRPSIATRSTRPVISSAVMVKWAILRPARLIEREGKIE